MRSMLLVSYHLCLRTLAALGLPFLVILAYQTYLAALEGDLLATWPRLILICGTAPMCLFFAMPNLLPRRVRKPDLQDLGPFLFIGLGFVGFAVMSLAQAAIDGLNLPQDMLEALSTAAGAAAILLGGMSGLLALTLCNQAADQNEQLVHKAKKRRKKDPRPSTEELRALRHARMDGASS